jgi:hypothetical protein
VKKVLPSGEQTLYIYDAMGQLAAEYTTGQSEHSGTGYLTVDHLGSIRVVTSQEKTVLARRDYQWNAAGELTAATDAGRACSGNFAGLL